MNLHTILDLVAITTLGFAFALTLRGRIRGTGVPGLAVALIIVGLVCVIAAPFASAAGR